jgi:LysM repeat protein
MRTFFLSSSILAALLLSAHGETPSSLRALIAQKESEMARLKSEITILRHKLSYSTKIGIEDDDIVDTASPKSPSRVAKATQGEMHLVRQGETFYRIAHSHGLSLAALQTLNPGIDPNRIATGQHLRLSHSSAPKISATSRTSAKKLTAESKKATLTPKALHKGAESKEIPQRKKVMKTISTPSSKEKAQIATGLERNSLIILTSETSFSDFAKKHGTSTAHLNTLNGWNYENSTILAFGSEVFVP